MKTTTGLLTNAAKFLVPVGIIAFFFLYKMGPEDWAGLRERPIAYPILAIALAVAFSAIALSFVRWWVLVRCQGISLGLIEALRLSSICFLLSFVSAGSVGGDLFKAVFLARRSPGKRVEAVASVFVDRGAGLYGLMLLVSAGLLWRSSADPFEFNGLTITDLKWINAVLVLVATAVLIVLVVGGRFVDGLIQKASTMPVVGRLIGKLGPPLRMFHHHPFAFVGSLLMSVGVHALLVVSMYLIAVSMYDDTPTFAEHFVIVPIGMLASALPLTPAGIGVLEATVDTLYKIVPAKVTPAKGFLVALMFEVVKVILAIIGTVFYWTASSEEQASLAAAEELGDEDALMAEAEPIAGSPSIGPGDALERTG